MFEFEKMYLVLSLIYFFMLRSTENRFFFFSIGVQILSGSVFN